MSDKNVVYETMTKARVGEYTVRVWRDSKKFVMGPDWEVKGVLNRIAPIDAKPEFIVEKLKDLMDVAAVEVLDRSGNGGLIYPDWK